MINRLKCKEKVQIVAVICGSIKTTNDFDVSRTVGML